MRCEEKADVRGDNGKEIPDLSQLSERSELVHRCRNRRLKERLGSLEKEP